MKLAMKYLALNFSFVTYAGLAMTAIVCLGLTANAAVVDLGSEGTLLNNGGTLASQWIRSDSPTSILNDTAPFIGSLAGGADLRGIFAFDLSSLSAGDTINSATVSLFHGINDTSDHQDGTITSSSLEISLITNAAYDNNDASWNNVDQSAGTAWTTAGGDFGSALATAAGLNLTTITSGDEVAFSSASLASAIQAAVTAGDSQISFMIRSPDLEAGTTRNFFAFRGGFGTSGVGTNIGPNLNIDFTPQFASEDVNQDGMVDTLDFQQISGDLFELTDDLIGINKESDINADGIVDFADFRLWKDFVPLPSVTSATAVPEPTSVALFFVGTVFVLSSRKMTRLKGSRTVA